MNSRQNLSQFNQFARTINLQKATSTSKVVAYTRVSSKRQKDENCSLDTQRNAIIEYAERNHLTIVEWFGLTNESAKSDASRSEFQRMLKYIQRQRGKIGQILVYSTDRFSRTGGEAIKLTSDLRSKYGVNVNPVTQPTDTSNPSGVFNQDIQLLFSHYDNEVRKEKAISGCVSKLKQGIWVLKVPQGYDRVKTNGVTKIVINKEGLQIRKAFHWKASGLTNLEIIEKLTALGVKRLYPQKLSKIFSNPFYCGVIVNSLLDNVPVQAQHEPLVSKELFLKVNAVREENSGYGIAHNLHNENMPLKVFLKCGTCGSPFTGYVGRHGKQFYYKCKAKGCKCNRNSLHIHELFEKELSKFSINPTHIPLLQKELEHFFEDQIKESVSNQNNLISRLNEVEKKIERIQEKHFVLETMDQETFDKFNGMFQSEKLQIEKLLDDQLESSSTPTNTIKKAIEICGKSLEIWRLSAITAKDQFQKLVFPEGVVYDRENEAIRPLKTNSIFDLICLFSNELSKMKKGFFQNEFGRIPLCGE